MKKLLLLSALLLACVFSASAQFQRRVLIEEFTNASCPPCAAQNPGFNALLDANYSKVTPVKYQTNWPGTDPMNAQNPSEVAARVSYYGVDGVPNAFMDGTGVTNDCNAYDYAPACLSGAEINAEYGVTTPVDMSLSYSFSAAFDTIFATVNVTSATALTGDLKLHVAVVEDAIYFNAAPGSNGEKEFFQPVRKMLPNASGTTTGAFAANETKTYTFFWKIPAYIYNENQLGVSAWLQDDATKNVYQSFRAAPPSPKFSVASKSVFVCTPGVSPSFTITNLAEEALTTATIRYRLGTNPWADYAWTGNLAAGESTLVTLSGISITTAGNNTLNVLAVNSNNGAIQTNINEGYATITVKGLFDVGAAMPFGNTFQSAVFPPTGWSVANAGTFGWKLITTAGSGSTRSAKNNMFDYDAANTELLTPKVSLVGAVGPTVLTFDHAYTYYDAFYQDSMRVEVSADCGATWTTVFHDGYEGLATAPALTTAFTPTASQWASHTIDVSAFNGAAEFFVRFIGESGFGNNLYLDNVNVTSSVGVHNLDLSSFSMMPNPSSAVSEVRFGLSTAQNIQLLVYNSLGSLVQNRDLGELTSGDHTVTIDAASFTSGSYRVVLQGKDGVAQTQWVVLK
jgi:hypothetical protein